MRQTVWGLILIGVAMGAQAQPIYKSERNGVTVYSATPSADSQKVRLPELSVVPGSGGTTQPGSGLPGVPVSSLPGNGLLPPPPPSLGGLPSSPIANPATVITAAKRATLQTELARAKIALAEQEEVRNGDERNYQKKLDRLKPFQDKVEELQKALDALGAAP